MGSEAMATSHGDHSAPWKSSLRSHSPLESTPTSPRRRSPSRSKSRERGGMDGRVRKLMAEKEELNAKLTRALAQKAALEKQVSQLNDLLDTARVEFVHLEEALETLSRERDEERALK